MDTAASVEDNKQTAVLLLLASTFVHDWAEDLQACPHLNFCCLDTLICLIFSGLSCVPCVESLG
jgi:hypothetical protein